MSYRVRLLPGAVGDLERLPRFLDFKSPGAAARSRQVLLQAIASLAEMPHRGRPAAVADARELVVPFGRDAYILRYRVRADEVVVTRIRHSRERR